MRKITKTRLKRLGLIFYFIFSILLWIIFLVFFADSAQKGNVAWGVFIVAIIKILITAPLTSAESMAEIDKNMKVFSIPAGGGFFYIYYKFKFKLGLRAIPFAILIFIALFDLITIGSSIEVQNRILKAEKQKLIK